MKQQMPGPHSKAASDKSQTNPISPLKGAYARSAKRYGKVIGPNQARHWHGQALSAYTWMRCDKGPQRWWLHHLGKAGGPDCPCGHHRQDGHHITFTCPIHESERRRLIRARTYDTWESLDHEFLIKDRDGGQEWGV